MVTPAPASTNSSAAAQAAQVAVPAPTFLDLLRAESDAKDAWRVAEGRLRTFLDPVLMALGMNMNRCGIEGISLHKGIATVDYGWSSRGYHDSDRINFPEALLHAADPVGAAADYEAKRLAGQKEAERAEKVAKLQRLAKELADEVGA